MRTIHVETRLPTGAEQVWHALLHPASFLYVSRGVFGVPALAGRTAAIREGECARGWLLLFHLIPLSRHTIHVVELDDATRTLRTREYGGLLKEWNHTLHVEPAGPGHCRYSDTVELDAGRLTGIVAVVAVWLYRYRQRRWHKLVRNHLMADGPRSTVDPVVRSA